MSVNVRLPRELHERLTKQARQQRRSLNSEILWLLEQALEATERPKDDQTRRQ